MLSRHPATIGREIKRNAGLCGFRSSQVQKFYDDNKLTASNGGDDFCSVYDKADAECNKCSNELPSVVL